MPSEMREMKITVSRANVFHVPANKWREWGGAARQVFNEVYSAMRANQGFYTHPKATRQSKTHWDTVVWNVAWTAAVAAQATASSPDAA